MNKSPTAESVILGIGLVASSAMAFAAASSSTVDALFNTSAGNTNTYAMLMAGLGIMGTIARRRKSN
jgi:hypothetical protein